ncbi:MAG: TonB C-terminal domain-containing protein [Zoogloeaceae bacterium]|jgi:colicin import membrane protein|nr:TonB C-terminal domain-containing protein [Zoogloeaceae bacterium]
MILETAPEPGKKQALAFSIGVHLLLVLALFLGVQWKTEHVAVEVELWSAIPQPATALPPPAARTPKPEPVEKPPAKRKADIAVKDEKKPKPEEKKPPRAVEKPDPAKELQKQLAEEDRERRQKDREAELRALADAEQQAAGRKSAEAAWSGKIRSKVQGNIVLPPTIQGNPEAVFEVNLLPTCEIVGQPRLIHSSGNPALDAAILRAILKSSPLPKPDDPSVFQRTLEITYRPYE